MIVAAVLQPRMITIRERGKKGGNAQNDVIPKREGCNRSNKLVHCGIQRVTLDWVWEVKQRDSE